MTIALIRNYNFSNLVENFLFSSVVSILGIRTFLEITGYPQLGSSSGLHIAHMLWGGLFMLIAIITFLAVLNRSALVWGSILGGIGFGFFIDEIGKFLTQDNNYFFKPTFAIIYGVFIGIYLISRAIEKLPPHKEENIANALEIIKQGYISGFSKKDRENLELILSKETNIELKKSLMSLADTRKLKDSKENFIVRIKNNLYEKYNRLILKSFFQDIVLFVFGVFGFIGFLGLLDLAFGRDQKTDTTLLIITNFIGITLILIGAFYLVFRKNRLRAYNLFRYSILIAIFFNQFSLFYRDQLSAIVYLFYELTLYLIIRYLIQQEERVRELSS